MPLPTGTATFLFTDIEGSTTLWEQDPDGMRIALARHDALMRDAIESNHGYIVKSTGDGVHAVFAVAADAVAAGVDLQRALQCLAANVGKGDTAVSGTGLPFTLKVRVGSTCSGINIKGASVYVTAVPYNQFTIPEEELTGDDGTATLVFRRDANFPASSKQQQLTLFIRATKPGEANGDLAGVSTRRLVAVNFSG